MTIRPVDLRTILPKTTEVSKIQSTLKENSDAQNSILATGFQEQLQTSKQRVNKRSKSENVKIEKDQSKSKQGNENKKHSKKQNHKKLQQNKKHMSHIDVKV
ncbi:hypothetical protein [Tepidanaerobacter sp. EBM-38]|uniref:hypothetical protein n=1 Tax=Tepidanaerobacter sp. EBM-38 TaxID=1918496 RepID=UPI000B0A523F|nr:hypothetical protein [Tepidanaerobacter sp. EBM-38]